MNLNTLDLLILSLATWRLARLLTKEDAPYQLMKRFRERSKWGVFDCIYCMSVWVSIALYLLWLTPAAPVVTVIAISGGAMMMYRYTGGDHT